MSNQNNKLKFSATDALVAGVTALATIAIVSRINDDGLKEVIADAVIVGATNALLVGSGCAASGAITAPSGSKAQTAKDGFVWGAKFGGIGGFLSGAIIGSSSETE